MSWQLDNRFKTFYTFKSKQAQSSALFIQNMPASNKKIQYFVLKFICYQSFISPLWQSRVIAAGPNLQRFHNIKETFMWALIVWTD